MDEEEIEATRKMQSSTETAEKTADELFDELGFNKYEYNGKIEYLSRERIHEIVFLKDRKVIESRCGIGSEFITMQELKAINKKVEELEWLDE